MKILKQDIVILTAVVIGFLFISLIVITVVPINMDESVPYHLLSCKFYPNAQYHIFRNPCDGSYNLDFLGIKLEKSYSYIGSLSSYLYYPFFILFPHIITQRVVGIIFIILLLGIILLLEKNNNKSVLIIFGLSFPLIYQLLNDTGPVRYSLLVMMFTPLFVQVIFRCEKKYIKIIYNIILGLILFLAIEDKPSFLYLLPSLAFLIFAYNKPEANSQHGFLDHIKLYIKELGIALVVFSVCTLSYLLLSKTSSGQSYFLDLINAGNAVNIKTYKHLLSFFTNFQQFSHRVYSSIYPWINKTYQSRRLTLLNTAFSLSIWVYALIMIVTNYRKKVNLFPLTKVTYTLVAFIVSIVILLITSSAWAGHHFIYCYVLGLLVICQCIPLANIRIKNQFFILYSVFSLFLAVQLFFFIPASHSSWERYKIFDYLKQEKIAKDYVITHINWGTYYVSALYGNKEQLVIYTEPVDNKTAQQVINLSKETGRKILCVCSGSNCTSNKLFEKFLNQVQFKEVNLSNNYWKVYVEEDKNLELS